MTWDTTTPVGTEFIASGDDRIRELKVDIQTALRGATTDGTEAKFPGSDTANPTYRYRGLKGTTAARPAPGDYGLYVNTTLNTIQRDNGVSWDDVATLIPSGTVMVFYQAAAPVGWTKIVTQNDKALRVVSGGTGGTAGGTVAFSTTLAHTHALASHTHDMTHRHTTPVGDNGGSYTVLPLEGSWGQGSENLTVTGYVPAATPNAGTRDFLKTKINDTANTGSASPAMDSQLGAFAYIDIILCSKD